MRIAWLKGYLIPSTYENAISSQSWVTKSDSPCIYQMNAFQGLHLIAILPDHEFRFSRANDHDLIRLERFTLVTYKKRGNIMFKCEECDSKLRALGAFCQIRVVDGSMWM